MMASNLKYIIKMKQILSSFRSEGSKISIIGGSIIACGMMTLYAASKDKVYAARLANNIDISNYMSSPITDIITLKSSQNDIKSKMELMILKVQSDFCHALESEEASNLKFTVDKWQRQNPNEGGGISCVLQDGETFEKAGVNVTVMRAPMSTKLQESMRARGKNFPVDEKFTFFAAGISSVIHPKNPHVPTIHFNYRYFEIQDEKGNQRDWWFGGGTDLTPYYIDVEDVKHFHRVLKGACDSYDKKAYKIYKKWCDKYFYIKHREECRGVGGIFFDDVCGDSQTEIFQFVQNCAESVIPSYIPIVKKNKTKEFTERQRNWQLLRRGRYVEFNLVYDRGTKFGFATPGARIESILMSLPLLARWQYMHEPEPGSPEEEITKVLKNPQNWV